MRLRLPLLCSLMIVGCAAPVATSDEALDPEKNAQPVIFDPEQWDRVTAFDGDSALHVGAGYARATAMTSLGCSAFLISDDVLVSAAHCRGTPPTATATLTAVFGDYGSSPGATDTAMAEARAMLEKHYNFTVTESRTFVTDGQLTTFECDFLTSEFGGGTATDVDAWRCQPKVFNATVAPFGRSRSFGLLPGHVWGHFAVAAGAKADGDPLYVASVNEPNPFPDGVDSVLLSPNGSILHNSSGGVGPFTTNAFEFVGADTLCGSSGGAIIDTRNHRVFGVVSGHSFPVWDGRCHRGVYGSNDATYLFTKNIGAYIGPRVAAFEDEAARKDPLPSGALVLSPKAGGNGGTARTGLCPAGFVVGGILGTRPSFDSKPAVGNFGLVCVPFEKTRTSGGAELRSVAQLDSAKVNVFGSADVPGRVVNGDYNEYIHERLVIANAKSRQIVKMCPPGSYVSGLSVHADHVVREITSMRCSEIRETASGSTTTFTSSDASKPAGFGTFGTTPLTQVNCPTPSVVTGAIVRAGAVTDAVQLVCSDLAP